MNYFLWALVIVQSLALIKMHRWHVKNLHRFGREWKRMMKEERLHNERLHDALIVARARIVHGRWLIFRDWLRAKDTLGVGDREVTRALRLLKHDDVHFSIESADPEHVESVQAQERERLRYHQLGGPIV